jgi:chromosome segregation ATPase
MYENQGEIQQYIANLKNQLAAAKSKLEELGHTPSFVRKRKGMEDEYQAVKNAVEGLTEKIKMARLQAAEMMAMEEAQGMGARLGQGTAIKGIAIVSVVLLVLTIGGALIYKKVKK